MNKHTPGPWKHVVWRKDLSCNPSTDEIKDMLSAYVDNTIRNGDSCPDFHMVVQECTINDNIPISPAMVGNGPRSEPNARLIAAAPDMLDELIEADATICNLCKRLNPQHANCSTCTDRENRWQIIERATGQSIEEVLCNTQKS